MALYTCNLPPPREGNTHSHVTLGGVDVIEEGLNGHPLDWDPTLKRV